MSVPSPSGAVFLSYAREDAAAARRLAEALRAHGVEVWEASGARTLNSPKASKRLPVLRRAERLTLNAEVPELRTRGRRRSA